MPSSSPPSPGTPSPGTARRDRPDRITYSTSTAFDRVLTTSRIVAVIGPIADLDVDRISSRMTTGWTPRSRLTLIPDTSHRRWAHDVSAAVPVTDHPELDHADVGDLVTAVRGHRSTEPLRILVCGRWLVADYSHGIGDGVLGATLLTLLTAADEHAELSAFEHVLPASATWQSMWRVLRENPRRLRDIRDLRAEERPSEGSAAPDAHCDVVDWTSNLRTVTAVMGPQQVRAVRQAVADRGVKASSAAVNVALWRAAMHHENPSIDERVRMLFNCRRYLAPRHADAQGNFAVAIPLRVTGTTTPPEIAAQVREIVESGWPTVILGAGELRGLIPRRGAPEPVGAGVTTVVPDRIRLSVSDLGSPAALSGVRWQPDAPSKILTSFLEPDGPDAISTLVCESDGHRVFSASFSETCVDASSVRAALDRLVADPVALLGHPVPER